MDPIIQMMVQGYFDSLDSMHASGASILKEIEDYKRELTAFAEGQNDAASFFPKFQESGMMGKFMDLSAKIALAAQAETAAASGEKNQKPLATPSEWLEPFRTAYETIKDYPIRERGLSVYRRLFEIGEKHSDITEFLLEVEKENLLWKISSEDTLGILEIQLTGMDPLYKGLTYATRKNIEAWDASVCEADIHYYQDLLSEDIAKTSPRLLQKERFVSCLGAHLMVYRGPNGKEGIMEMIATGNCPRHRFLGNASNMVVAKLQARRMMDIIHKNLGLRFEDIMADEYLRFKLISSSNVYALSKAYVESNSNLLDILADAFYHEILPDISLSDAIKRETDVQFGRWRMPQGREVERAGDLARKAFRDLPYSRYEDQLQGGSIRVGTGEGFEINLRPSV